MLKKKSKKKLKKKTKNKVGLDDILACINNCRGYPFCCVDCYSPTPSPNLKEYRGKINGIEQR